MKILYIITQADGGGAQKYVLALAKHFGGAIAAGSEDTKLFDAAKDLQLTTYNLKHLKRAINPYHDLMAVWEIRQLINSYRPDIIHLNSSKAGVVGSFASIGTKTKVVYTAHGFIFNEPLPFVLKTFYLALEKVASSYRDFIITVSNADEESALKNKLISKNKISTIHNGIEQIYFLPRDEAIQKLGLSANKKNIGVIANFYKTKGLDVLLKSLTMLKAESVHKISLNLIGDGPEILHLKSYILNHNLTDTVNLIGKIDNADQYLKAFDLFAIPSRKEGFPYVALEAMQAGLPIIASDVGGLPEALGDAGILVSPNDPEELAKAIEKLLYDADLRNELAKKTLERSKLFTEEKMFEQTNEVYKKLLR